MPDARDSVGRSRPRLLDELRLPLRPGVREREAVQPTFGAARNWKRPRIAGRLEWVRNRTP